jgi:AcrR family transcriptional regulator
MTPRAAEDASPSAATKGERTREHILSTALRLFRDDGYEETSMRAIAEASGVSVGNAYHYFDSKEHLVQAFYELTHREHLARCEPLLEHERDLSQRLRIVLTTKIETAEPYHHLSALLFRTAIDPKSPLSPFSSESSPLREEATALMRHVVEGSKQRVPADLAQELPSLLWMFEMSIILFWIHDESSGRKRTKRLIARTCKLVARLVSLASFPLLKPLRNEVVGLMAELRDDVETPRAKSDSKSKKRARS